MDDGSRDATATIARACAARHPQVRLLQHAGNRGKGAAVRTGMLAAQGKLIGFSDADLSVPVDDIERLFRQLEQGAQAVIASRTLRESVLVVPPSPVRHLLSRSFNRIVRTLFALPYRDTQCGLKGFQRHVAHAIFSQTQIDGFAFDVEVLLLAQQLGYAVDEMAVRFDNPRRNSVRLEAHTGAICRNLWKIHQRRRTARDARHQTTDERHETVPVAAEERAS